MLSGFLMSSTCQGEGGLAGTGVRGLGPPVRLRLRTGARCGLIVDMPVRRFEFKDSRSYKFWEINVEGNSYTVRYGKVGTDGVTQTKSFASPEKAASDAEKKLMSKVRKGYAEVGSVAAEQAGGRRRHGQLVGPRRRTPGRRRPLGSAHRPVHRPRRRQGQRQAQADQGTRRARRAARRALLRARAPGPARARGFRQGRPTDLGVRLHRQGPGRDARVGFKGPKAKDVLRAIVKSPAGKQLRDLTVGLYDFEGGGLSGVASFKHLESLKLERNYIPRELRSPGHIRGRGQSRAATRARRVRRRAVLLHDGWGVSDR